ncbi:nuclease-related domain-containing protein [Lacisediminihabitans changchengi]|uniref:NERD domain-containing protein n=1 Tax=Lacisediminihabitans changchengi TaxID=2787634 RepID=A0A934SS15_9MICO|nr:nuclease-related domain-containing protein [Lacisediminihabitans changchengi]MBK4346929.1 NERD domain-containing protein [Lacisediminihabitans changchengi]MBK4347948.1 NERD domain-containing protein [Lacisediminihabitans changchengi]
MSIVRERFAGQAVMERLLIEQESVRERSPLARLFGVSPLSPNSYGWYAGALGEIEVGERLSMLPAGWTVLHALPLNAKGSDIDHIAIGPAGVFTITTRLHRHKKVWAAGHSVLVDGQKQSHIRVSLSEAARIERMLPTAPVRPVLALVDPERITFGTDRPAVEVTDARRIVRWLTSQPTVLSESEVSAIVTAVEQPDVWHGISSPDHSIRERFASLDRSIRVASSRRAIWCVAAAGIAAAMMFETVTRMV